jgi:uncharacterized protein YidB (DUF937 family)
LNRLRLLIQIDTESGIARMRRRPSQLRFEDSATPRRYPTQRSSKRYIAWRIATKSEESTMSLLDSIGSMFGTSAPQAGSQQAVIAAALEFVNSHPGGLGGLIQKFEENGAGGIIRSWIGNDDNQPISGQQLQQVLGSEAVASLAQKVGLAPDQASNLLSQVLPHVVNAATPEGEVPAGGKLNAETVLGTLGSLASLIGKKDA